MCIEVVLFSSGEERRGEEGRAVFQGPRFGQGQHRDVAPDPRRAGLHRDHPRVPRRRQHDVRQGETPVLAANMNLGQA